MTNDKWFYAGEVVEMINSFAYLGVVFSSGGFFIPNSKTLSGKSLKTMHQLLQLLHEVDTSINIALNLFESLIAPVLNYGCEVWGFINAECIERVDRKLYKYIIHIKQTTNNYALYSEEGRYPLSIERRIRIVKYWFNLMHKSENNYIINSVHNEMKISIVNDSRNSFWLTKLKKLLEQNGFAEVWMYSTHWCRQTQ